MIINDFLMKTPCRRDDITAGYQRDRHTNQRGRGPLGTPQIFPEYFLKQMAYVQSVWDSHCLFHHFCGLYGVNIGDCVAVCGTYVMFLF